MGALAKEREYLLANIANGERRLQEMDERWGVEDPGGCCARCYFREQYSDVENKMERQRERVKQINAKLNDKKLSDGKAHPLSQKQAYLQSDSGKLLQRMGDSSLSVAERSEAEKLWRASLGQTTDYSKEVPVSENLTEIPQDGVWQLAEMLGYDIGPDGDFVQSRPVWEKHHCPGCNRTVWTLQGFDEVHSFVSQRGHAEGEFLIDYDGEEPEKAMDSALKLLEGK